MTQIENFQKLVTDLAELVDELQEKKRFQEEAFEKGGLEEADRWFQSIEEITAEIETHKKYIAMKLKEI
jgi:hypothetical protein